MKELNRQKKSAAFIGLTLAHFVVMILIMIFLFRPLNYLIVNFPGVWTASAILTLTIIMPPIFVLSWYTIAKKQSLLPETWRVNKSNEY